MKTSRQQESEYKTVGIIGGGTAGYLTALSFRALRPEIAVTLIESSKIPIIGVGEATTSEIVPYLHRLLGLDVHRFFREVRPTWKLGIRFEWGTRPEGFFNYPFDAGNVLEPLAYFDDLQNVTQVSALMAGDKMPVLEDGGVTQSLLWKFPFAYHLDNKPFVHYLQGRSAAAGVKHVDAEIVDAELEEDGESIRSLVASDNRRFQFDLYIDCTGFRSFLIERKLKSRYISYSGSLFTDSAVVAPRPHHGLLRPYTTAETMNCGWCWNIPQVDEDHRGYVFSSAFCSVDEAAAEMKAKNPEMRDFWTVKFRTGRHEHFWKGNVVAIGNSYGFVEPLESTAIQVVLHENHYLLKHLPLSKSDRKAKDRLNVLVAGYWDYIRWFLSIHYKFNRRLDTPFWKACRETADISGAAAIVEKFRASAPLVLHKLRRRFSAPTFNSFGFDVLLAGQGVPAQWAAPRQPRELCGARLRIHQAVAKRALLQWDALEVLKRRPDLLDRYVHDPAGWVARMSKRLRYPEAAAFGSSADVAGAAAMARPRPDLEPPPADARIR
jgi:tryptophan 7-halogenase